MQKVWENFKIQNHNENCSKVQPQKALLTQLYFGNNNAGLPYKNGVKTTHIMYRKGSDCLGKAQLSLLSL